MQIRDQQEADLHDYFNVRTGMNTQELRYSQNACISYLQGSLTLSYDVVKYHAVLSGNPADKNGESSVKLTLPICVLCTLGLKTEMEWRTILTLLGFLRIAP